MPTLNTAEFMAKYGAQAALAATVPEIMDLLQRAIAEGWTAERFGTEFLNTKWANSGAGVSWRKAEVAKVSDPTEYTASVNKTLDSIKRQAISLGITIDNAEAKNLAEGLLKEYWGSGIPSDVMNQRIMALAKLSKVVGGKSMSVRDSLAGYAASMGVGYNPSYFDQAAKSVAAGTSTIEQWNDAIKQAAKSKFPMFASQIDAGVTMDQIASPYKQTMAQVLELPAAAITFDDPTIKQAFGSVDKDGKPSVMGLWDFEKSLRNDPRWAYTKNARSSLDAVAHKVLQDFGLAY